MAVTHFTRQHAKFHRYRDKDIFVGDVLDASSSEHMSAGYYLNLKKGQSNPWIVTYDEILVVIRGVLVVRSGGEVSSARAGEILFLRKGTELAYEAGEDDTEVVYVTYPHWLDAHQQSEHAELLEQYHPVAGPG